MHPVRKKLKYVETVIAALLKQEGFKKKRLVWRKQTDKVAEIINIQLSQTNSEDDIRFYVNLGVCYNSKEKNPEIRHCQRTTRLEYLSSVKSFVINERTDEKKLALQIEADLKTLGFSWLELVNVTDKKYKYIETMIAAFLKENKFKRESARRNNWRKRIKKITYIVSVYLSHEKHDQARLSIKLGVFDEDFYIKKYSGTPDRNPDIAQCEKENKTSLQNLKDISNYYISDTTDEKEFALQLIADLKTLAFTWFERTHSLLQK